MQVTGITVEITYKTVGIITKTVQIIGITVESRKNIVGSRAKTVEIIAKDVGIMEKKEPHGCHCESCENHHEI